MELDGQVAIVTGASRGIGRAIALELGRAGARVIVNHRSSPDEASAVAAEIPGAVVVAADVSTEEGVAAVMAAADALGRLDIVVNNAGITDDGLFVRMKDEQWARVLEVNAGSAFRMCRAAAQRMFRARSGSIVNVVSVSALRGNAGQANYSASKAAILGMTRSLARELGRRGVRVNAVAPGFVETDMTSGLGDKVLDAAREQIPLGRIGAPGDIAPMVRFLAGPGAGYVTGQCFVVDGGLSC